MEKLSFFIIIVDGSHHGRILRGGGGGGFLGSSFAGYVHAACFSEPLPHYSLFCGQL